MHRISTPVINKELRGPIKGTTTSSEGFTGPKKQLQSIRKIYIPSQIKVKIDSKMPSYTKLGKGFLSNAKELAGSVNLMRFLLCCSNNISSSCCRSGVKSPTHQKSPSTPNFVSAPCRSGTKKQKTPSTGDLYKYLSLSYDSTSPKKFAGLVLKFSIVKFSVLLFISETAEETCAPRGNAHI